MTIYFEKQYAKVYIDKKTIFNTALEVWLELRKTISPERNFEEVAIFESFLTKFIEKFQSYKISKKFLGIDVLRGVLGKREKMKFFRYFSLKFRFFMKVQCFLFFSCFIFHGCLKTPQKDKKA